MSEGKLVQPSVNEEKLVLAGVSEEKLIQPSVSEGKLSISRISGLPNSIMEVSTVSYLHVCACVYSFQSRLSSIYVLFVLSLTCVGLCLTVY